MNSGSPDADALLDRFLLEVSGLGERLGTDPGATAPEAVVSERCVGYIPS
jgi:hypothetical protein